MIATIVTTAKQNVTKIKNIKSFLSLGDELQAAKYPNNKVSSTRAIILPIDNPP